jgi:hypothetical protein
LPGFGITEWNECHEGGAFKGTEALDWRAPHNTQLNMEERVSAAGYFFSLSLSLTPASTCTAELAVNTLARVTQSKQIKGYSDVLGNRCRFFTGKIIVQTIFSVDGTGYTVPMQF